MRRENADVQQAMDRAVEFYKEFSALLGNVPALDRIEEARKALVAEGATQYGADKAALAGTQAKAKLRVKLRAGIMLPISRIATAHAAEIAVPEMEAFTVPHTGATDVSLLEAAESMAVGAEKYYAVFRGEGLGEDFLDALREATRQFKQAILHRDNKRYARGRVVKSAKARAREARRTLKVLGAVVERKLVDRPELIDEWRRRIRVPQRPSSAAVPAFSEGGALKIA